MYLEYIPRLNDDHVERFRNLMHKIEAGEIPSSEVFKPLKDKAIRVALPLIMKDAGPQIATIMPKMISLIPSVMGKQLFVRIKRKGVYKVTIGLPPALVHAKPSSLEEIKSEPIPGVELESDLIFYVMKGVQGLIAGISDQKLAIYGGEKIAGWFPHDLIIGDLVGSVFEMLSKDLLGELQKVLEESAEEILSTYGV